MTCCSGTIKL